jgi:pentatricopeptide repeat protein
MRLPPTLLLCVGAGALCAPLSAQDPHHHGHGDPEQLGRVEFPTSCDPAVQPRFERAVALLHSFWWSEAEATFTEVARADPGCAMAHWGLAMVARSNPFAGPPGPEQVRAGRAAAVRATELSPPTPRERGYVAAVRSLFDDAGGRDHSARAAAYEEAMRRVHEAHPDDPEAAIFYALALTSNTPFTDHSFERQRRAGRILGSLLEDRADHPGIAHYLIHTYDAPPIAHLGVEAARQYSRIAPSVPHALHMPSHIFTRLGMWDASIEANLASAEAAREYEERQQMGEVSFDRAHAWDYLVYAYLQQGRDGEARGVLDEMRRSRATPSIATDYAFAAIPARYALERGRWADAARLDLRASPGFPAGEAITHFARGLGAARLGDLATARREVGELERIRQALQEARQGYWGEVVEAQRLAVLGWVAHAGGQAEQALDLLARAAEIEERVDKHPVTPGPIVPARELEGDLLLELGRFEEALGAYETALRSEPNRARLLFGAGRAAELAGRRAAAKEHYAAYLEVMRLADQGRPEPVTARAFLNRNE